MLQLFEKHAFFFAPPGISCYYYMSEYLIAQSGRSKDRGSIFDREKIILLFKASKSTLGPNQPPIQYVARNISRVVQLTIYLYLISTSENLQRHFELHMWRRA